MSHTCADGTRTKLVRVGPLGTMVGVTFHCPHCGMVRKAMAIMVDAIMATDAIKEILSK